MHDRTAPKTSTPPQGTSADKGSIGFGLFLLLAGLIPLGERLGWLPEGMDWLFPVILLAWGASELYRRLTAR
ncbi:MAG: hypothetical protein ACKO2N_00235 [Tabrizicola sp.]